MGHIVTEVEWWATLKLKLNVQSVQFSPLTDWVVGGTGVGGLRNNSAEIPFQSFL